MFKTILFPIDLSRESRQAMDVALNVVKTYSGRLVLLSVAASPAAGEESASPVTATPEAIAELLTNAKQLFAEQGINAETIEREGIPAFVICDVADEVEADLIVMGSRGMGLTDEGAADSVSNRVINLSPCPVLIVP
ncbi:MAG: universal stress protein [Cyanothece sp. SIO1E1]|nr:universal stress protein [Cyanothece sp. SIO1E1]